MKILRVYWLALLFVALSFALTAVLYDRLPESVPAHWNLRGEVDGWLLKPLGPFFLPIAALVTVLLLILTAHFRGAIAVNRPMPRIYPMLVAMVAGFMLFVTAILLLFAIDSRIQVPRLMAAAIGLLFAVIGNYMGKVPRNGMIGIRLPWTLASDEVWERTHRFAAPIMVAGGLCLFGVSLVWRDLRSPLPMLVILALTVGIPVVKSWLIWRAVRKA